GANKAGAEQGGFFVADVPVWVNGARQRHHHVGKFAHITVVKTVAVGADAFQFQHAYAGDAGVLHGIKKRRQSLPGDAFYIAAGCGLAEGSVQAGFYIVHAVAVDGAQQFFSAAKFAVEVAVGQLGFTAQAAHGGVAEAVGAEQLQAGLQKLLAALGISLLLALAAIGAALVGVGGGHRCVLHG